MLCPVRSWGAIIDRIEGYKGTTGKTTVNTVEINGKLKRIDSSTIRNRIRVAVKAIGEEKLGFTAKEVGTHSIRTSFATLLYLRKVDPIFVESNGCLAVKQKNVKLSYAEMVKVTAAIEMQDHLIGNGEDPTTDLIQVHIKKK